MNIQPGYESLAGVLQRALDQAQTGKGAERHANELPFHRQPMQTLAAAHGVGFLTGQACKKAEESHGLPHGRNVAELLGSINYLAGAIIFLEGQQPPVMAANDNQPQGNRWPAGATFKSESIDGQVSFYVPGQGWQDEGGNDVETYLSGVPIVQMKRLGELSRPMLEMLKTHCEAELLRKRADEMQGRDHG